MILLPTRQKGRSHSKTRFERFMQGSRLTKPGLPVMDTKSGEACSRVSSVSTAGERRVQSFMSRQIARVSMQSRCHRNGAEDPSYDENYYAERWKFYAATTQVDIPKSTFEGSWLPSYDGFRQIAEKAKGGRSRFRRMDSDRAASVSDTRAASSLVRNSSIPGTCHHRPRAAEDADALEGGGRPAKRLASKQTHLCSISAFSNLAYCMRAGAALSKRSPVRVQERDECRVGLRDLASGLRRGKLRNGARLEQML